MIVCLESSFLPTMIPVSYTHLDVYKRQTQGGSVAMEYDGPRIAEQPATRTSATLSLIHI